MKKSVIPKGHKRIQYARVTIASRLCLLVREFLDTKDRDHRLSARRIENSAPGHLTRGVSYEQSAVIAAAVVAAAAPAVIAAAAENDDEQNDDPAAVASTKAVIAHIGTSYELLTDWIGLNP